MTDPIVLHHEAAPTATAQQIHEFHKSRGWSGIGYHYYVRKDGRVYRGRPEDTVGTHTVDYNWRSIGVCFEGNFQNEPMGAAQFDSGRELVLELMARYPGIGFLRHGDVNATACPGTNFPFEEMTREMTGEEIFQRLNDYLAGLEESGWSEAEGHWLAAENRGVVDGTAPRGIVTREQLTAILGRLGLLD